MPTIERTMTTDTDPAAVWEFLQDFRSTEQWDPPTRTTLRISGDGGVGTVYRNISEVMGHDVEITYTVVEHEAPRLLRLRGESDAFTALDTIEVVPDGTGTRVHYTAEFDFQGVARLAAPLAPLGLERIGDAAQEQMTRCLDDLPRSDEGPASTPSVDPGETVR